jgi:CBS domain-containing protein
VSSNGRRESAVRELSGIVRKQQPVALPVTASVRAAAEAMRDHGVGSVLVIGADGRLAGIFTGRDAVTRVLAEGRDPAATSLATVMTPDPETLAPGNKTIDALRLMAEGGFRHVPVVRDGKPVGVVSRSHFHGEDIDRLEYERDLWEHL